MKPGFVTVGTGFRRRPVFVSKLFLMFLTKTRWREKMLKGQNCLATSSIQKFPIIQDAKIILEDATTFCERPSGRTILWLNGMQSRVNTAQSFLHFSNSLLLSWPFARLGVPTYYFISST